MALQQFQVFADGANVPSFMKCDWNQPNKYECEIEEWNSIFIYVCERIQEIGVESLSLQFFIVDTKLMDTHIQGCMSVLEYLLFQLLNTAPRDISKIQEGLGKDLVSLIRATNRQEGFDMWSKIYSQQNNHTLLEASIRSMTPNAVWDLPFGIRLRYACDLLIQNNVSQLDVTKYPIEVLLKTSEQTFTENECKEFAESLVLHVKSHRKYVCGLALVLKKYVDDRVKNLFHCMGQFLHPNDLPMIFRAHTHTLFTNDQFAPPAPRPIRCPNCPNFTCIGSISMKEHLQTVHPDIWNFYYQQNRLPPYFERTITIHHIVYSFTNPKWEHSDEIESLLRVTT